MKVLGSRKQEGGNQDVGGGEGGGGGGGEDRSRPTEGVLTHVLQSTYLRCIYLNNLTGYGKPII